MNKEELAIATISWVRNKEEEMLLRSSLSHLASFGLPVAITDGGSPQAFVKFLESLPNFTVSQATEKGVFAQAKASLTAAAKTGRPFIFYTEPDKEDFFKDGLPEMIKAVDARENTGVVLASRSEKGFASFPAFQQLTESTINRCCEEVIGLQADYCYGPFLLSTKLVAQVSGLKEDTGWGWRPFVFTAAHRLGYEVESFENNFYCPDAQREDDAAERLYRMKQLEQNIRGLITGKVMNNE